MKESRIQSLLFYLESKKSYPYFLLAPALIAIALILLYPLVNSSILSLMQYDLSRPDLPRIFVGVKNFIRAFSDHTFLISFKNTMVYTISTLILEFLIALPLTLILAKRRGANVQIVQTIFIIPMMIGYVVTGLAWKFMYLPEGGLVNTILGLIGINGPAWLSQTNTAMPALIIMSVWKNMPFVFILLIAAIRGISQEYYDCALIDGASVLQRLRYITLPLLRPVIFVILVLRTTDAIRIFDEVYTMTGGGPGYATETMCLYAYNRGFISFNMGYASAVSYIMLAVTAIASYIYLVFIRGREELR